MEQADSTPIVLAVSAAIVALGPRTGLMLLFAMVPFGMMAAFQLPALGGASIVGMDVAVVVLFFTLLFRAGTIPDLLRLGAAPSGRLLLLLLLYATIVSLFGPRVFAGATDVFTIGRVDDDIGIVISPLAPSGGNMSQLMRFYLSVGAFAAAALVVMRRPDPALAMRAMVVVTVFHVGLGFVDILTNAIGRTDLLERIRTANYALTLGHRMAGLNRMIGGYPEASAFGYVALGLFAFWLSIWYAAGRSRVAGLLALLSGFVLLRSTSSSAYVGLVLLLLVFAGARFAAMRGGTVTRRSAAIVVAGLALLPTVMMGAYILYETVPAVTEYLDRSLINKVDSNSADERGSWDRQAFINFVETNLIGAGLGSVRGSSWIAANLGTIGLPGFLLNVAFLWALLRTRTDDLSPETRQVVTALKIGCVGFLMRALVVKATPNLDIVFYAMAGMIAGYALAAARGPRPQGAPAFQSRRALLS
jgi:hypothetical protein